MNGFRKLLVALACGLPMVSLALDVTAKSAIVIDGQTGKILWSKDAETPRFPASTTKIMTALLLLEHCPLDQVITAPTDVTKVKESSMHLKPGEKVSVRDMLYALMLRSANDGCYAVACHVAGSVPKFSQMMNDRARQIGCTNTHFDNPNGLNDPLHTVSAHDLALIAREAMKNPVFREVVRTTKYAIHRSIDQNDRMMANHNKWLKKDLSADGIKTGYTVPAGHCYVGSATRDGYRIITVVMNSAHWQKDHQEMLNWAFATHQRFPLVKESDEIATAPVVGGVLDKVSLLPSASVDTLLEKPTLLRGETHPATTTLIDAPLKAPIHKGQTVGTLVVKDTEGFEQRVPLVAGNEVAAASFLGTTSSKGNGSMVFLGGALLAGTFFVRGRARRTRFNGTQAVRSRGF